jgi:probable rRNA maturation factor
VKIAVYNQQKIFPVSKPSIKRMVEFLLHFFKVDCDEIAIYLVSKKKICKLHKQFFNDPTPTDCITLPIDHPWEAKEGYSHLGELFVCPEVAAEYTKDHQGDLYEEISLYIVHAMLHLLGYDDLESQEKKRMRYQERRSMKAIKKHGLLVKK